jgi:uncharacterized protein (DUF433 family)
MEKTNHATPTLIRNSRGLSIIGTRITLYQIIGCLKVGLSPELIRDRFRLTIKQMNDVMVYINQHRDEIETEYQQVLNQAEKNRQYWENSNREQLRQAEEYIATKPPQPEQEKIWRKLQAWKSKLAQENSNF